MGRERPEDVLLGANLAQIQPVRVDVLNSAELSLVDQPLEPQHRRVVPEQVADHQHSSAVAARASRGPSLLDGETQRLLDEDVLAR